MLFFLNLSKSVWHYHQHLPKKKDQDQPIKRALLKAAKKHPSYGYRKMRREVRRKLKHVIGDRRIRRLMRTVEIIGSRKRRSNPSLIISTLTKLKGKANLIAVKEKAGQVFQIGDVMVTDFTVLIYAHGTKVVYLIALIGYVEKVCWGWAVGEADDTTLALLGWARSKRNRRRWQMPAAGVIVHHDRDSVFTGYEWVGQLAEDRVSLSYTLYGCKDNPAMESFNGHFKGELKTLVAECETIEEVRQVVGKQMRYYNWERQHASVEYLPPMVYLKKRRRKSGKKHKKKKNSDWF